MVSPETMNLVREPLLLRRACDEARARGHRVALVPTMGALHAGHVALLEEARRRAEFVVVSIFVNPTQFGPHEDLTRYPRPLEADLARCQAAGASLVFAPSDGAMYVPGDETRVRVGATAEPLCGVQRPVHFEGVATVVTKLLVLAGPCVAVFGRKDYQQFRVITRLVKDLFLPVDLVSVRTVRQSDGLALSSRNAYLSPDDRALALSIPRGLSRAVVAFARGERGVLPLLDEVRATVVPVAQSVDYISLADADSLRILSPGERVGDRALVAVAARFGGTRLIDNVVLGEDEPPLGAVFGEG